MSIFSEMNTDGGKKKGFIKKKGLYYFLKGM